MDTQTVAIVPAAGAGVRMGGNRPKQFLTLRGKPILAVTLEVMHQCEQIDTIIVVVPKNDVAYCKKEIVERFAFHKVQQVVKGGLLRQDSVRMGLEAVKGHEGLVVIHDGVRPLLNPELFKKTIEAAIAHGAAIAALPAKETVKAVDDMHRVTATYDRNRLWMVQTPQAFFYRDLIKAHQMALSQGLREATDDALLVEKLGVPVRVVQGLEENIKVTTPHDLELANFLLSKKAVSY